MNLLLPLEIPKVNPPIQHPDRILLLGSCFTEHMAGRLEQHGFRMRSNPQGILFNPVSTAEALVNCVEGRRWQEDDLFQLNELWNSWSHHSRFSHIDKKAALLGMNESTGEAHRFLKEASWVIVTLGTSFQYLLKETGQPVANNHRGPAAWFEKKMLSVVEVLEVWRDALKKLFEANAGIKVILTVSPVRHARDGAIANNRSKGRLLDAVHSLCEAFPGQVFYFPAYEIVVDVLRDYRFYDSDLIHPNHAATQYVWERFVESSVDEKAQKLMERFAELSIARGHRPRFPETEAHQAFRKSMIAKVEALHRDAPWADLSEAKGFFME
jgi:hypothetical protein